ncbi:hypothetical protein JCM21900_006895, partial [Sporobolomyces salmonicolor]
ASTTINHTAHVEAPAHDRVGDGARAPGSAVQYDVQKRTQVAGTVLGAGGAVGRSRTVVEAHGPAEIVVL